MNTISHYIFIAIAMLSMTLTSCNDDENTPLRPHANKLSIHDFSPLNGKGGTQVLINGEKFPLDASQISITINGVELPIVQSNEEQLLVQIPDNELIGSTPISIRVNGESVLSKESFVFQKTVITSFSPNYGKVGTQTRVYIANLPTEIKDLSAMYNGLQAQCVVEEDALLITIPETTPGMYPIILNFNGRILTTGNFEYKKLLFERIVTTLPNTDFNIMIANWEYRRGGIAADANGNVFLTDIGSLRIRKIDSNGAISTAAGTGTVDNVDWGLNWRFENGGAGSYNAVVRPTDLKMDSRGNMYVCDDWTGATVCFEPDGKALYLGNQAAISLAIDEVNNRLYCMKANGDILLKDLNDQGHTPINAGTLIISGNGSCGGMEVDKRTGDLYTTNIGTHQIIKYVKDAWSTPLVIAGSGSKGNTDGALLTATFACPWGLAITNEGNLLVAGNGTAEASADNADQSIRYIDQTTSRVTTFAGSHTSGHTDGSFEILSYAGMESSATGLPAAFGAPSTVCVASDGTVYVLDRKNNCVKKVITLEK